MNNYMVDENYNEGRIIDCNNCICYKCKLSTRSQKTNMANCHNCDNCKRHSNYKSECDDVFIDNIKQIQEPTQQVVQQNNETGNLDEILMGVGAVIFGTGIGFKITTAIIIGFAIMAIGVFISVRKGR